MILLRQGFGGFKLFIVNMVFKKYWLVVKNTFQETLVYRLNLIMWRVRTVLQLLTMYFLWLAVLPKGQIIAGYNQSLMLTYILGTSLLSSIVISSRIQSIGDEINRGDLSNYLLKPFNYFFYWFSKDIGDKAMNIIFSIVELSILFYLLKPPFFVQKDLSFLGLSLLAAIFGLFLYFFFNFLIGLLGFWSPDVWAPRFIFTIILSFFAGGIFPLDILPKQIFSFLQFLPFPYLLYFPLKIYLGKISMQETYFGFLMLFIWIFLLYLIVKFAWERGLKIYTAEGR